MDRLKAILGRKVAGIPIGVFVALGIVVLVYYLKKRQAAATAATANTGAPAGSAQNATGFPGAAPMNYSSDVFLNGQQLAPGAPTGGQYMFKLQNDPFNPDAIYIGMPGTGYYWVPNVQLLQSYLQHNKPVDLGTISQQDATNRFGTLKPWSQVGQ